MFGYKSCIESELKWVFRKLGEVCVHGPFRPCMFMKIYLHVILMNSGKFGKISCPGRWFSGKCNVLTLAGP